MTRPPARAAPGAACVESRAGDCLGSRGRLIRPKDGLVELASQVRKRHLGAIADMPLDLGGGSGPRLCDLNHQLALAGVVGLIRPA